MKTSLLTRSGLALLLSAAAPAVVLADEEPATEIPGAVSAVTLNFTLTSTAAGTVRKDEETGKPLKGPGAGPTDENEWTIRKNEKVVERGNEEVTKMAVSKYSNKELLQDLKNKGIITDIKGWSVSRVQATLAVPQPTRALGVVDVQSGPVRFYLTHKTLAPISIDDFIGLDDDDAQEAMALNSKRIIKYNAEEAPTSDVTTHSVTYKGVGSLYLDIRYDRVVGEENYLIRKEIYFSGLITGGEKLGFYGPQKIKTIVPTAGKIGPVAGFSEFLDEESGARTVSVVEGSVGFGAGVVKNVADFPDVTVDPDPEEEF